jgi:hypothetical protein
MTWSPRGSVKIVVTGAAPTVGVTSEERLAELYPAMLSEAPNSDNAD